MGKKAALQTHEIEQGLSETVSLLDKLRMAIYRGEFPPGQRLVEGELAEKYKTSRGAVREALALLQNEQLVTRQRNRSAWVRAVTIEEAIEILEVRALIEGLCAARAATRVTEEDRRELRRLADAMTDAVSSTATCSPTACSATRSTPGCARSPASRPLRGLDHRPAAASGRPLPVPRVAAARTARPGRQGAPGHHRRGDRGRPGGGRSGSPASTSPAWSAACTSLRTWPGPRSCRRSRDCD